MTSTEAPSQQADILNPLQIASAEGALCELENTNLIVA